MAKIDASQKEKKTSKTSKSHEVNEAVSVEVNVTGNSNEVDAKKPRAKKAKSVEVSSEVKVEVEVEVEPKILIEDAQPKKKTPSKSKKIDTAPDTISAANVPQVVGAAANHEQDEAFILGMKDDDYMSATQLAFFKQRLLKLKHDILTQANKTTENLRESIFVPDPVDRASIEEEHALELRTRDRERKLLMKIEQSLHHIEDGSYGWCEETGEPIGVARLIARPTATLCLEAQERREHRQKMFGED